MTIPRRFASPTTRFLTVFLTQTRFICASNDDVVAAYLVRRSNLVRSSVSQVSVGKSEAIAWLIKSPPHDWKPAVDLQKLVQAKQKSKSGYLKMAWLLGGLSVASVAVYWFVNKLNSDDDSAGTASELSSSAGAGWNGLAAALLSFLPTSPSPEEIQGIAQQAQEAVNDCTLNMEKHSDTDDVDMDMDASVFSSFSSTSEDHPRKTLLRDDSEEDIPPSEVHPEYVVETLEESVFESSKLFKSWIVLKRTSAGCLGDDERSDTKSDDGREVIWVSSSSSDPCGHDQARRRGYFSRVPSKV